ncbi:site-specific integrase [Pedobacter sp. KR3-3]|uniref:Site-specific integrase n=1 Tax=Pedobacter albus TaxID=3113905 RepID=A0ABU7I6K0_9SPHI|nr:site-specific integrase [Pedobacter sp. KR3-3]MEE1945068.1 site-specific integrase [Pedobacter sp. KR3-3]
MKTLKRQTVKTTKHLLANFNGVEVFLVVPEAGAKEQKYYLDYKKEVREKYYGKGSVKKKAVEYFKSIDGLGLRQSVITSQLVELFKSDLSVIENEILSKELPKEIGLHSKLIAVLKSFYAYKELQQREGTVGKTAMYGYKHHQRKLELYFSLPQFSKLTLAELNSGIWLNYRIDLLNNRYNFGKKPLKNSSVNQHFLYVAQLYSWLIEYNELPIKNHPNKLNKLNEAQQEKRFKVISNDLLREFYDILETYEKYYFTRLYLSALFLYENNIRLSEQVLIKVADVNLENNTVKIVNNKNDKIRTVIISAKVMELINIIKANTIKSGIQITPDMYIVGGYNMFKSGIPHGQKELGIVMRRFRRKYPQFGKITLYEHKHTSITHQFNNGVDPYQIKERANHGSISTTEIYLQASKKVTPYELNFDLE